jgi:hypothetical protein
MNVDVIDHPLHLDVYGFSGIAVAKDYAGTAFQHMNKLWKTVTAYNLPNKGQNIWIYDPGEKVFAGVELEGIPDPLVGLELRQIRLDRYARYTHVGPYSLIQQKGNAMRDEIKRQGLKLINPYIEIYGHWTNDESKLETDLIMAIQ